ncbi:transposase [Streptomyces johnsoniae]|uniref:Transposase n=1 Tax=Streptomyces johnsoniae TaxID=3075532 RepID=A0ABU2SCE0_9ACTN|nr:transposase [Streptomyces sp. DSM 41886]MDT0446648.1 transposase [Streptomyces sp. DSM 41886]
MGRPPALPVEDKVWIVLQVLAGSMSAAEAARRNSVSGQTISTWKRQFVEGGTAALAGDRHDPLRHVQQLTREVRQLKIALGEAHVEIRKLRRSPAHRRTGRAARTAARHARRGSNASR